MNQHRSERRNRYGSISWPLLAGMVLWTGGVLGCLFALHRYESTPGNSSSANERWPEQPLISRTPGVWTCVMFAHPRCPCTRSSLIEFSKLLDQFESTSSPFQGVVAFYCPMEEREEWSCTETRALAESLPSLRTVTDWDGNAAAEFHATCSGTVCLYDPQGNIRYFGGITPARGQQGANRGSEFILAMVSGHRSPAGVPIEMHDSKKRLVEKLTIRDLAKFDFDRDSTYCGQFQSPVFGCSLLNSGPLNCAKSKTIHYVE